MTTTIPQITKDCRTQMEKSLEASKRELASIRTGKATTNLLDTIRVDAYGQQMPINQVGSVAVPEPRLITVTPWDKGLTHAIEKALRESDLGLNPQTQSGVIRVPLPALNEQRRKELVKVVHKLAEEGRIAIRHARTAARDQVKHLEKASEDEQKRAEKELQKMHDDYIHKIDELLKAKEAEIMEV
jgi:ribosome recycling factor